MNPFADPPQTPAVQAGYLQLEPGDVGLLGIAWDCNSSHLRGPAAAPAAIRAALRSDASNSAALPHLRRFNGTELERAPGLELADCNRLHDLGDIHPGPAADGAASIRESIAALCARGASPLALGGDHAISYPVIAAMIDAMSSPFDILHFDAHPDLYAEFEGNPYSHASPFARVMEYAADLGRPVRLVQMGIRTLNEHQRQQATRFGVEVHQMPESAALQARDLDLRRPVYISIDLDALDPAYAPGVSHHEPGGLTTRELLSFLQALPVPIVGADIVELNPRRDIHDMTATVAAKLCKQLASQMLCAQELRTPAP